MHDLACYLGSVNGSFNTYLSNLYLSYERSGFHSIGLILRQNLDLLEHAYLDWRFLVAHNFSREYNVCNCQDKVLLFDCTANAGKVNDGVIDAPETAIGNACLKSVIPSLRIFLPTKKPNKPYIKILRQYLQIKF